MEKKGLECNGLNIAVCDDEANVRCLIKKMIEKQTRACRILEFSSGGELLRFWRQENREQIDILFLDIFMDDTDGMETAEQIRAWKEERDEPLWGSLPLLVFVTGHPEYMAKAFSVNAFHYLIKPIDEKEFADIFAHAVRECSRLGVIKSAEPREILVKDGNITRSIPADDIYYIESNNRKIIIAMRDEKIECYGKISGMERELQEGFFRTHRGYLVNMKYVERYSRTEVQMKNGSRLLISKYKYQEFVRTYLTYLAEDAR